MRKICYGVLYIGYRMLWKFEHRGKEFEGMRPVCFMEWMRNECNESVYK